MSEVEKLVDIINDFFGCDAAYFDINPFDLAMHLIDKGIRIPTQCKDCKNWDAKHYDGNNTGWCSKVVGYRCGTWYCAAGKENDK